MFSSLNPTQKGMFLALFGYSSFALSDACAKWLTASYSVWEIICIDTALSALIILGLSPLLCKNRKIFEVHNPKLHFLRTVMNFLISVLFVLSITRLPLAAVYTLAFTKPFFAALLAMMFYGERAGPHRIFAIVAGFSGILVALHPGVHSFDPWLLLSLLIGFFSALMFVVSRSMADDNIFALGFYPVIGCSLMCLPLMLMDFKMPPPSDWVFFIISGFGISSGLICVSLAFRMAPGAAVSPFHYAQLLWGLALGYLMFGDLPDGWMMTGAAIIIASGFYLLRRESRSRAQ